MADPSAASYLQACGLPQAWRGQSAWSILDTEFAHGLRFLHTWNAWSRDPQRPGMLHYVALTQTPASVDEVLAEAAPFPHLAVLAKEMASHWFGLMPGFHRLVLGGGKLLLTLCIGKSKALLREQHFLADAIYLEANSGQDGSWDNWAVKALARHCRRGSALAVNANSPELHSHLAQCGFQFEDASSDQKAAVFAARFDPVWKVKRTRRAVLQPASRAASCAVIGAGLAGAGVASALAQRGWTVTVFDQHDGPAAGASGLPAGLIFPHVSTDDCVLSRLSRSGVRLMLQQAGELLRQGLDWAPSGVLEYRLDDSPGLPPDWPACGQQWSQAARDSSHAHPAIWHGQGAWLKPAALVRAWLTQTGITFRACSTVSAVEPAQGQWRVLDPMGKLLVSVDRVVFANAGGAVPLLKRLAWEYPSEKVLTHQLPAMSGMRGQLSWARHSDCDGHFAAGPVNGSGSMIPWIPDSSAPGSAPAWYVGSTYQDDREPELPEHLNHADNLAQLARLLPALAQELAPQFTDGSVRAWKGTRCVTTDRLPLVGPLQVCDHPGLWICAGMGSRGLTFSALCAELLAAQWCAEPWPIEARLARSLTALRLSSAIAGA